MREWARANGLEEMYDQYLAECKEISAQCREEGYPDHGSNYEIRVERLQENYLELFGSDEDDDEEDFWCEDETRRKKYDEEIQRLRHQQEVRQAYEENG